jgi:hypothetical protein
LPVIVFSQNKSDKQPIDPTLLEAARSFSIEDLYEMGVRKDNDSLYISDESAKAHSDSEYRKILYPETYTWEKALTLIAAIELKKAFWHLINLYPKDQESKEFSVRIILGYDSLFDMERVITSTFYTYAFMDPEIGSIKDGKIDITRPDILEGKLHVVKEMMTYIHAYRQQNAGSDKNKK